VVPAALARASCWRICSLGEGLGGVPAEHDRRADLPRPPCPPAPHDKRKGVTETDCARLLDATLANLAKRNLAQLTALIKTRLRRMQYRPGLLDGFLASSGLDLTPFCNSRN